ncbi:hypothetical protein V8F06_001737 [Rhypophila decipiens]
MQSDNTSLFALLVICCSFPAHMLAPGRRLRIPHFGPLQEFQTGQCKVRDRDAGGSDDSTWRERVSGQKRRHGRGQS